MKTRLAVVVAGVLIAAALLIAVEPGRAAGEPGLRWLKGNLHTHSFWSDGNDFPEMINDWYRDNGYHFLGLSDHNTLNAGEKWLKVSTIEGKHKGAIEKYTRRFGSDWVMRRGSGKDEELRLRTLEEYRKLHEKPGEFLLIQAEEITDSFASLPVHRCAANLVEVIKPRSGNSVREVIENNLAAVLEQEKRTGVPMLPHLNHPNFRWGIAAEDIAPVRDEKFFEVFNGHPGVNHLGDDLHASMEKMWDIINTLRMSQYNLPPLYGVGTDDSHKYNLEGLSPEKLRAASSTGRGWVMVRAAELSAAALIHAMKAGDFYASSGVTLSDVRFDESSGVLTVEIAPEAGAEYTVEFIGTPVNFDRTVKPHLNAQGEELAVTRRYSADVGKTFATARGVTKASYKLTGNELYVRAVITSSKDATNPAWEGQKQQAWSQPVGWKQRLK